MRKFGGWVLLCACLGPMVMGVSLSKPKHIRQTDNPARYAAFSRPLSEEEAREHVLNRLTFGATAADREALEREGMEGWIDSQLHPERIAENTLLMEKLRPYASIRMSPRETVLRYPPPRLVIQMAKGTAKMPDDPEIRRAVYELSEKYLKRTAGAATRATDVGDDESGVEGRTDLHAILDDAQMETLASGKPDEKEQVLASIPAARQLDLVWALRPSQRKVLMPFAPVALRRELMISLAPQRVVADDLTEAKLLRAVYSTRQLNELLVDFWFNHFNVFIEKGADRFLTPTYERDTIRPHVLDKFYDLLLATAQSPAMLFYLDNWQSSGPGFVKGKKERGLNENYGRELLELHTLGVDGGYTQKDVIEVARCFTGWTIARPNKGGEFMYDNKMHDQGEKIVLGHRIPANGGMKDGLEVLKILSRQPATAHFISLKLAQRFVADDPPPSLVSRMEKTFRKQDGDLRAVMTTMLRSPEFWSQGAYRAKVKTPFEMVASALRVTGAQVDSGLSLGNEVGKQGEPLYRKIEPTGYSFANAEWVSSAGLLERMNFSLALTANHVRGVKTDLTQWPSAEEPVRLAASLLNEEPGPATAQALEQAAETAKPGVSKTAMLLGLTLGSPEFQRH